MKITVDEAAAFDALAILFVKVNRTNSAQADKSGKELCDEIISQIGKKKYIRIVQSREFQDLMAANGRTFDYVELAAKEEGTVARKAHDSNMERFNAKKSLQEKFFKNPISEIKTT